MTNDATRVIRKALAKHQSAELMKKKGPASAATDPGRGSTHPSKGSSNVSTTTTKPPAAAIDRIDLIDRLQVAVEYLNAISLAVRGAQVLREDMNALCRVADAALSVIENVQDSLSEGSAS